MESGLKHKRSESGLPEGEPSKRGVPLSEDLVGVKTFAVNGPPREFDKEKDKPISRVEYADDLLSNGRTDINDENADKHDGIGAYGEGVSDSSSKTKWPYRYDYKTTHNASVVERYLLDKAHSIRVQGDVRIKVALRSNAILEGLNPQVIQRSQKCTATLKRVDTKNLRWIISVDCGNIPRLVGIKAFRNKPTTKISLMDLDLKCSCPAWQYSGAEYHSKREDYLDGKPRGTASVPVIRDPDGTRRVCKHVRAALDFIKDWTVPTK